MRNRRRRLIATGAVAMGFAALLAVLFSAVVNNQYLHDVRNLDKIPWEGGNEYYSRFPDAARAGWSEESFIPVAIWWAVFDRDEDTKWDKSHGINTYVVTSPDNLNAVHHLENNRMFWIGGQLPGMTRDSPSWIGDFLDDEVDGRFGPREGFSHLEEIATALPDHDKIRYANYTSQILNQWFDRSDAEKYVNDFTDTVSIDQYWHTVDFCDNSPYRGMDYFEIAIPKSTCRSPSSYGKTMRMLRVRDEGDGRLQPLWNFVEVVSGSPAEKPEPVLVQGDQLKGAVMNSLIHEARGIVWFSTVFGGPCGSGNAVRSAQYDADYPCRAQVEAMAQVNEEVRILAPVLNTQTFIWDFGPGLESMLKVRANEAYIFAMAEGAPGRRSLSLPRGISSPTADVLFEGRVVEIRNGEIVDDFKDAETYHIYRLSLS